MPEGDRFEKQFRAGWIGAARYIRDGKASVEETGDKLAKTLAKRLRDCGGVPGFDDMLDVITGNENLSLLDSFNFLDDILRRHDGNLHSKVAAEVAKSVLVQQPNEATAGNRALARSFAENICAGLLEYNLFSRAEIRLIDEGRFSSREEFRAYRERLTQQMMPGIRSIAGQLVRNPNGKGLRAPNRKASMQSTSAILVEDLLR